MLAATWTAIGVLAAVSFSFIALVWTRLDRLEAKFDAKFDTQTARLDEIVKDVGEMKGDLRVPTNRVTALETHRV